MKKNLIYMYFAVLAAIFKVALTSGQWLLTIDLHQFHNMYNAEKRGVSYYCCCDIPTAFGPCQNNLSSLPMCTTQCDTQFFVSVSECQSPPSCIETTELIYDSFSLLNLDYSFIFILSSSLTTDLMLTIQAADDEEDYYQEEIDIVTINISFEYNTTSQNFRITGNNSIGIFNFTYRIQNINKKDTSECSAEMSMEFTTDVVPTESSMKIIPDVLPTESSMKIITDPLSTELSAKLITDVPRTESSMKSITDTLPTELSTKIITDILSTELSMKVISDILPTMISVPVCSDKPVSETDVQTVKFSASPSAWIAVAVLFMLLTLAFLIISIILMCVVCYMKKVMNADDIQQTNSLSKREINYCLDNPVYQMGNSSEQPFYEQISTEAMIKGNGHERITASTYETPIPLAIPMSETD